jgi:hypothetical protein
LTLVPVNDAIRIDVVVESSWFFGLIPNRATQH